MKSHPLFEKKRIFAPGPTPIPDEIRAVLSMPVLHHRTKEFEAILIRVREGLKVLFETTQPVYVLTSSGTGAMEAAIVNLFSEGDEILVVNGGKFGERWGKIAQKYKLKVHWLNVEWGHAVTPDAVEETLKTNSKIQAVFLQASETSTCVAHPVEEVSRVVHNAIPDAMVIVDGITALGVSHLPMDAWKLDVVVGGSQKAQMLPPGLAYLALSEKAQLRRQKSTLPKFYFNLDAEDKALAAAQTAWTPAVGLVCGLDTYLERLKSCGLNRVISYYAKLAEATRRGIKAMDLSLMVERHPSPAATAIKTPDSIGESKKIVSHLRDRYGITIAGGQDHWAKNVFRIGHLGFYDELDILTCLTALELTLKTLGHSVRPGAGVGAAETCLLESPNL